MTPETMREWGDETYVMEDMPVSGEGGLAVLRHIRSLWWELAALRMLVEDHVHTQQSVPPEGPQKL
jgi:hypothetical protein